MAVRWRLQQRGALPKPAGKPRLMRAGENKFRSRSSMPTVLTTPDHTTHPHRYIRSISTVHAQRKVMGFTRCMRCAFMESVCRAWLGGTLLQSRQGGRQSSWLATRIGSCSDGIKDERYLRWRSVKVKKTRGYEG